MKTLTFPDQLVNIPEDYFTEKSQNPGQVIDFYYDTYESFTYNENKHKLTKHAVVYLPAKYDEHKKYPVLYMMHGGWSDENTYLGNGRNPSSFKNVLDNAISKGEMTPMIVVNPTYNNLHAKDSWDYELALQLTMNYHNELVNDLMPAIANDFSTYAEKGTKAALKKARDYQAFVGLSMGSVTTWRTFQYCLDYFRYFMPSSGSINNHGEVMAQMVKNQGHKWNDFFIFAASGTKDFAYPSFSEQINSMANVADGTFRVANNEKEGNLYYLVMPGATHGREAALTYFYNGMIRLWKEN